MQKFVEKFQVISKWCAKAGQQDILKVNFMEYFLHNRYINFAGLGTNSVQYLRFFLMYIIPIISISNTTKRLTKIP